MTAKNIRIFRFEVTDSTNLRAREYIRRGEDLPALFVADSQTNGRGRKGKSFYSPAGTGLYMSLAIPYGKAFDEGVPLTVAVSVALLEVLSKYTDKALSIKWVNDLLADGKKVSGILCEAVTDPDTASVKAVIIGIGVNLTTKSFPEELIPFVTGLGDKRLDAIRLATEISNRIFSVLNEDLSAVLAEYRKHSAVLGKNIFYIKNGKRYDASVLEILNDGSLKVLRSDNTEELLSSGEITIRLEV